MIFDRSAFDSLNSLSDPIAKMNDSGIYFVKIIKLYIITN